MQFGVRALLLIVLRAFGDLECLHARARHFREQIRRRQRLRGRRRGGGVAMGVGVGVGVTGGRRMRSVLLLLS